MYGGTSLENENSSLYSWTNWWLSYWLMARRFSGQSLISAVRVRYVYTPNTIREDRNQRTWPPLNPVSWTCSRGAVIFVTCVHIRRVQKYFPEAFGDVRASAEFHLKSEQFQRYSRTLPPTKTGWRSTSEKKQTSIFYGHKNREWCLNNTTQVKNPSVFL